ncbi:hypothetical protein JHD50_03645 [Sulfurimonas sp. MAG313]|nr:hypothetical protein [Sulfurimonas sp. MAG313]MDF1880404.1 hypothetical protein [Sulfurimonas sp. MAG313]
MKYLYTVLAAVLIFTGCGDEQPAEDTGTHFQGRDCLSCHNIDLKEDSYLSIGGTVYRSPLIPDTPEDNLNSTCTERIHMQLLVSGSLQYDSKNFNPEDAPGFNGVGNLFTLIRNTSINAGSYQVRLYNDLGQSQSSAGDNHSFSSTGFDLNNPSDLNNRFSCNACHQTPPNNLNGAPGKLFIAECL